MDLSIVDLSPVPRDGTATDAYANTVGTAQQAEQLGYERFWVAEHHGMASRLTGTTPEVLLGHLAAETESIRLGSGAVLLNHYPTAVSYPLCGSFRGLLEERDPVRSGFW